MGDIRLKKITVEPSQVLTIQSGNVNITNTNISSSRLTGAFIIDGGVGINCTYNSVSSTSGGALTVGGGLSVYNETFLGNNLIMDNNSSTLSVNGISIPRLFVDSVINKYMYISPDGITKRFELYDTKLNINITTASTNSSTGAFVVDGGIAINASTDAINSSNGGSLTVRGGIAIGGNTFLSKQLNVGELYTNQYGILVRYTGDSQIALQNSGGNSTATLNMENNSLVLENNDDILFKNASTGNTLITVSGDYTTFNKYINISDTIDSINRTTASLIVSGGVTIQGTRDAMSITNGGGLTVNGGMGIVQKTFMGDSLGIELGNNNKSNKVVLYQENQNITEGNLFTGVGVTGGSLRFQVYDTNKDFVFFSSSTSGTSSEVLRIKGTNEIQFVGAAQRYSFLAGGNTLNDLSIQGQSVAESSSICFFTKDGDRNENNDIKIFGFGQPNGVVNSEYVKLGWDTTNYVLSTNKSGTGVANQLCIETDNNVEQIKLLIDGSVYMSSTKQSNNSTTGGLVLAGGVGVTKSVYIGDELSVTNSLKGLFNSNTLGNIFTTGGNVGIGITTPSYKLDIQSTDNNALKIGGIFNSTPHSSNPNAECTISSITGGSYIFMNTIATNNSTAYGRIGVWNLNGGDLQNLILNSRNVGIGTTSPGYKLDVSGGVRVSNVNGMFLFNTEGNVAINTTSPNSKLHVRGNGGGNLILEGDDHVYIQFYPYGFANGRKAYIGFPSANDKNMNIINETTSGNIYIETSLGGSISLSNAGVTALYASAGNVGVATTLPEATFDVNGTAKIRSANSASNSTTGAFVVTGGVAVSKTSNAVSITDGGALTIAGGMSVSKDVYMGGDLYNYGAQNFYTNTSSLINLYDVSNLKRFSIDRNATSNDFSISRYNVSGSFVEKSIEIVNSSGQIKLYNSTNSTDINTGGLVVAGGVTIQTTEPASTVQNGGGLTVFGGASINKNMYIGGDVVLSSTTASTNSSQGALRIAGGVGISGNVNILGDTLISGNLSIVGSTNTVYSTETLLPDNILVINSGPSGSSDGGILVQRYQTSNDTGSGDVVNDLSEQHESYTLPSQSGMTTTELKLPISASASNGYYVGWWVKVTSGFSVNQVRKVTGYVGSTKVITIESAWTTQNPGLSDTVNIYNRPYAGIIWKEISDTFAFGTSATDPGFGTLTLTEYASLELGSMTIYDTTDSSSSSVGVLISNGGISIKCSTNASSITRGGAFTVAGGVSIGKSVYVGDRMYINGVDITPNIHDQSATYTFTAGNNVTSANIPTIEYSDNTVWGFDVYLAARLTATSNLYANYHIRAVNKVTSWELVSNYVGDSILSFNITNTGQLQYSTPNFSGFSSLIFKYKVITN